MAGALHLHIERREFKYLIDEATADRVREAIRPFCERDPFASKHASGRYTIDSLYLDTAEMSLFNANEEEGLDRFKLRIRTYPETPGAAIFTEVKRRFHDIIVKDRGRVPADWPRLFEGAGDVLGATRSPREAKAVERFVTLARTLHARPIVLVRYEREPWASVIDDYVRITFDRKIRSQKIDRFTFDHDPRGWRATDHPQTEGAIESMVVLELKFTTNVPWWLIHIVQRYDLTRRAFSKYGLSVRAWREEIPTPRVPYVAGIRL